MRGQACAHVFGIEKTGQVARLSIAKKTCPELDKTGKSDMDVKMKYEMLLEEAAVVLTKPRALNRAQKRAEVAVWETAIHLSFVEWTVEDAARRLGCREQVVRSILEILESGRWDRIRVFWLPRDTFVIWVSSENRGDGEPPF